MKSVFAFIISFVLRCFAQQVDLSQEYGTADLPYFNKDLAAQILP